MIEDCYILLIRNVNIENVNKKYLSIIIPHLEKKSAPYNSP